MRPGRASLGCPGEFLAERGDLTCRKRGPEARPDLLLFVADVSAGGVSELSHQRNRGGGSPPQRYYPPAVARIIEICQRTLVRPVGEFELAICAQRHLVTRFTNQVTGSDFSSSGSS
jgi:hypothetical protein